MSLPRKHVTSVLGAAIDLLAHDDTLRVTLAAYLDVHGQLALRSGVDPRVGTGAMVAWLALQLTELGAIP